MAGVVGTVSVAETTISGTGIAETATKKEARTTVADRSVGRSIVRRIMMRLRKIVNAIMK